MYIAVLFFLRLMGKKQIGELRPYELVITLLISNVATFPIGEEDATVWDGIVPIVTLFILHFIITELSYRSIRLRRLVNGKPLIVINKDGIDYSAIRKIRLTSNDIMSYLRQQGYFCPSEVAYAIIETNGQMSIMPSQCRNGEVPYMMICEGILLKDNVRRIGTSEEEVRRVIAPYVKGVREVALMLLYKTGEVYLQPKHSHYISYKADIKLQEG